MNCLKLACTLLTSCLLISCSHNKTDTPVSASQSYQWVCDTGAIIEWQAEDKNASKIQLRLDGGEKLYILDKIQTTAKGTLYSNGDLAFRIQNSSGVIFLATNDEIIGQDCKAN